MPPQRVRQEPTARVVICDNFDRWDVKALYSLPSRRRDDKYTFDEFKSRFASVPLSLVNESATKFVKDTLNEAKEDGLISDFYFWQERNGDRTVVMERPPYKVATVSVLKPRSRFDSRPRIGNLHLRN